MTLPMTEEEFERQYKAATARGNLRLKMQPLPRRDATAEAGKGHPHLQD